MIQDKLEKQFARNFEFITVNQCGLHSHLRMAFFLFSHAQYPPLFLISLRSKGTETSDTV